MAQYVITLEECVPEDRLIPYLVIQYGISNPRKDRWTRGILTADVPDPEQILQDPWVKELRMVGAQKA